MSRIQSKNTKPELLLRKALSKMGYRYRINYKTHGHPDIAFTKARIAIFMHGCFWHQHGCNNSVIPKTNYNFWKNKLKSNVRRDRIVLKMLKKEKWSVLTIWECELEKHYNITINKIKRFIKKRIGRLGLIMRTERGSSREEKIKKFRIPAYQRD